MLDFLNKRLGFSKVNNATIPYAPNELLDSDLLIRPYTARKQLSIFPWGIHIPKSEWYLPWQAERCHCEVTDFTTSIFSMEDEKSIRAYAPETKINLGKYPISEELTEKMETLKQEYSPDIFDRLITRIVDKELTIIISPEPVAIDVLAFTTLAEMKKNDIAPDIINWYRNPHQINFRYFDKEKEVLHVLSPYTFHSSYEIIPGGEFSYSLVRQKMGFFKNIFDNIDETGIANIRGLVIDYDSYSYFCNLCNHLDRRYIEFIETHRDKIPTLDEIKDFNMERFETQLDLVIEGRVTSELYYLGQALEKGKYVDLHDNEFTAQEIWNRILQLNDECPGASCLGKHKDKVLCIPGFDEKSEFEVTVPKSFRSNPQINRDIKDLVGDSRDMRLASLYCGELTMFIEDLEKNNAKYGKAETLTLNDFYTYIIEKYSNEVLKGIKHSTELSNTRENNPTNIKLPKDVELLDFINFALIELANNPDSYDSTIAQKYSEIFNDSSYLSLKSIIEGYSFKELVVADRYNKYEKNSLVSHFNYGQEHLKGVYFRNPLLLLAIRRLGNHAYVYNRPKLQNIEQDFRIKRHVLVCASCSTMHNSSHEGSCIACGYPGFEAKTLVFEEEKVS